MNFRPQRLFCNCHFQTVAASWIKGASPTLHRAAREMILETEDGVRLQGFYSAQPEGQSKGLVLMLPGWLGSAEGNYLVTTGEKLYGCGYAVFRLNMRDHGETHQLNQGLFRGDLLDEVFAVAHQIANLEADRPFHIFGVSLGGNFALRMAWRHSQFPLPNLGQTIAINPALNPYHTTLSLDHSPLYLPYFRRKWRNSLRKKAALFPDLYDFSAELATKTCMAMTEHFVRNHSPYPDVLSYFKSYTIKPEMMRELPNPVTIVTAADDPIVPVSDFHHLQDLSPNLQVSIQPHGGHVGFIHFFPVRYWLSEMTLAILEANRELA